MGLVFGHGGVDFGGPGGDAAGEVFDVGVAVLLEDEGGFLAAAAGFAVGDDFGVLGDGDFCEALLERAEGDLGDAEIGDDVFVGVADVEDEGSIAAVHAGLSSRTVIWGMPSTLVMSCGLTSRGVVLSLGFSMPQNWS